VATIRVTPQEYTYTTYEAGEIERIVLRLAGEVGLDDATIEIDVDESTPLARTRIESIDEPVRVHIEGGALEDPTAPRELRERLTSETVGRLLLRVVDRRSGRFADAPADEDLSLAQLTAWETSCLGRLERLGYDVRPPRRRYHFRTRHGFSDVADAVFDRLWATDELSWADIDAACAETEAAKQPA
jgi:hypothetical protein